APPVAVSSRNRVAIESFQDRHDYPPGGAKRLPQITDGGGTVFPDELHNRFFHSNEAFFQQDNFFGQFNDLIGFPQKFERLLGSGIGRKFLTRRRLEWFCRKR